MSAPTYELDENEAVTVARALIMYNRFLLSEFEKITGKEEVSEFIKNAAHQQYQELTRDATQLHVKLADAFPRLTQQ